MGIVRNTGSIWELLVKDQLILSETATFSPCQPAPQNLATIKETLIKRGDGMVGRNDPCPCRREKKYEKKMCGT